MMKNKRAIQKYARHSTVEIANVLLAIKSEMIRVSQLTEAREKVPKSKAEINGQMANVSSLRLQTFCVHGIKCKTCGVEATHFALERGITDNGPYHLNLWGTDMDGEEILFTHDHILARALGGKDNLSNTQTMCCYCNWEKGVAESVLAQQLKR